MTTTYTKTWISPSAINLAPTASGSAALQYQDAVLLLKKALCGQNPVNSSGAWSVVASSNGSVANTSDNWNSDSDIVFAAGGTAHSWIILSRAGWMPGGTMYLKLDCNSATQYQLTFELSSGAYTTSYVTGTAPTATNVLTWSNQQWLRNNASADTNLRIHVIRESAGGFMIYTSVSGVGRFQFEFYNIEIERWYSSDNWPHHASAYYDDTHAGGAALFQNFMSFASSSAGKAFKMDGTARTSYVYPALVYDTDFVQKAVPNTGNAFDSTTIPDMEIYSSWNPGLSPAGIRGRWIDIRQAPSGTGIVQGEGEPKPPATPLTSAIFGDKWIPADAIPLC